MADAKQDKLGAINNAVVDEFKARGILVTPTPDERPNDNITRHLAEHLQIAVNVEHFGDEGSKRIKAKTLNDLALVINNRRAEANLERPENKLELISREQITEAVLAGWKKVAGEMKSQTVNQADVDSDKQDRLGAINNAVVDGFKARNILVDPDPEKYGNDNITRHLAEHLQAVLNAKHFGDDNSKTTELKTLHDLTGIINERRAEANLKQTGTKLEPITKEQVTAEVVTGWNKVLGQVQEQQKAAGGQKTWAQRMNDM